MVKAGIVDGTGHTGLDMSGLHARHSHVEPSATASHEQADAAVPMGRDRVPLVP